MPKTRRRKPLLRLPVRTNRCPDVSADVAPGLDPVLPGPLGAIVEAAPRRYRQSGAG